MNRYTNSLIKFIEINTEQFSRNTPNLCDQVVCTSVQCTECIFAANYYNDKEDLNHSLRNTFKLLKGYSNE